MQILSLYFNNLVNEVLTMTNEDAKNIITDVVEDFTYSDGYLDKKTLSEIIEALNMAIVSLTNETEPYNEDIVKLAIKAAYKDGYDMARAKYENHECDNCRYSDVKITDEPCFSCDFGGCAENINLSDRWEPK